MSTTEQACDSNQELQTGTIADEISSFVHSVDAIQTSLPFQLLMSKAISIASEKNFHIFLEKNGKADALNDTYEIGPEHFLEYDRLSSRVKKSHTATVIMPQAFVVALVSQYDSFLGGLLRCLYKRKPELLRESERHLTYAQLCNFSDLERAKEDILEKEIEAILRTSHIEQFDTMENRFKLHLKKDLPIWPVFVELTERRNLFAHCNGKVSAQYLAVCDRHKVDFGKRPRVGDTLGVTPEYFDRAHACIFEIGTKLAHVLWRKILPHERKVADGNLLMLGYDLLVAKNYDLAITLGTFALETIKTHSSEDNRRRMVINLAQAYKWRGRQAESAKIIDNEDWSSCGPEFQLAVLVLRDDFKEAARMMKIVSAADLLNKTDYRDWPLFSEFRKSQAFVDTYKSIYGHHLIPIDPHPIDQFFGPAASLMTAQIAREFGPEQLKNASDYP